MIAIPIFITSFWTFVLWLLARAFHWSPLVIVAGTAIIFGICMLVMGLCKTIGSGEHAGLN